MSRYSSAWRDRMMSSTRCPCSIAGSRWNSSRGRYFNRTSRPSTARQVRCRRLQRRLDLVVRPTERGIVDPRLAEVGRDVDAR